MGAYNIRVSMPLPTVEVMLDYLYELKGEWAWKKDEPIRGNDKEYEELVLFIAELQDYREASKNLVIGEQNDD